jgi:DNA-binding ferritin-like protein
MAKSLFPQEMLTKATDADLSLESIAAKLTYFHEQLHLTHWQTTSYAQHKATGKLYEYVQDFKDGLIEKLMGYIGKRPGAYRIEPLTDCTAEKCTSDIMSFASSLKAYGEKNAYHDVCNLADALSGEAAKTKYLLTLS